MEEKLIDLMWEVKEGKKHPNRAYKELCVLFKVVGQSEQLKCKCKKAQFTRTVNENFEPMCGKCGKPI